MKNTDKILLSIILLLTLFGLLYLIYKNPSCYKKKEGFYTQKKWIWGEWRNDKSLKTATDTSISAHLLCAKNYKSLKDDYNRLLIKKKNELKETRTECEITHNQLLNQCATNYKSLEDDYKSLKDDYKSLKRNKNRM